MFTRSIYFNQWMEFNQTRFVYGYMNLTFRRDDAGLVIWTIFDLFRSVQINCINILKFKNNGISRYECVGWISRGRESAGGKTSVCFWKTFPFFFLYGFQSHNKLYKCRIFICVVVTIEVYFCLLHFSMG